MSMQARINTDSSGNITIHMEGGLNYDNTLPLRRELQGLCQDNPQSTIILDLNKLDFVGSSGISHFVETIQIIHQKSGRIRLSGVSDEFIRVFKLYKLEALENMLKDFESDFTENTSLFAGRKKTFEN